MSDEAAEQTRKLRMLIIYLVFAAAVIVGAFLLLKARTDSNKRDAGRYVDCQLNQSRC